MKKLWIVLATSATLLLAAGCGNDNATAKTSSNDNGIYDTALTDGKDAISNNEFDQAEAFYKTAKSIKTNDSKSAAYYKQAKALAAVHKNITDLEFDKALDNLKVVTTTPNGLTAMNDKAKDLQKSVKKTIKNRKAYNKLYNTAKKQNSAKNYAQADAVLSQLLAQDNIDNANYADIRLAALTLKANNSASAASSDQSTSEVPATNNDDTDTATSNAATSSSDAPAEEQSKAASGGEYTSSQDTTVNGKDITAAQISKARAQLKEQGVDTSAWSDLDIIHAIQNANADGRTTVKESDMTNYK